MIVIFLCLIPISVYCGRSNISLSLDASRAFVCGMDIKILWCAYMRGLIVVKINGDCDRLLGRPMSRLPDAFSCWVSATDERRPYSHCWGRIMFNRWRGCDHTTCASRLGLSRQASKWTIYCGIFEVFVLSIESTRVWRSGTFLRILEYSSIGLVRSWRCRQINPFSIFSIAQVSKPPWRDIDVIMVLVFRAFYARCLKSLPYKAGARVSFRYLTAILQLLSW